MSSAETIELGDALRENENLRDQQRAIGRVLRAVARSEGLQPVLDEVVEAASSLCEGEYGALFLARGDTLHAVSYFAPPDASAVASTAEEQWRHDQRPHARDRTTLVGRVALTGKPVHVADLSADPEYSWPIATARAGLGVPILVDGDLLGAIVIVRDVGRPFDASDVTLVETFGDQAAIAIANARLIDAVERQLDQQRAIGDVLKAIALSEGLEAVFEAVVAAATRLCHADFGALYLRDGDLFHLSTRHEWAPELDEFEREHPHVIDRTSAIGRVALTRDVVHIPDVADDPEYEWGGRDLSEYHALLAVPVTVEGDLIGALDVTRREPGPFTDEEVRLIRTFADQAAIAIANARLIETTNRQLEHQRAIGEVLGVVARSEGLQPVFDAVVEAAARLCEAEYGQLHLADGDLFRLAGDYGAAVEIRDFDREHPIRAGRATVVGRVALTREVVHVPDVLEDPEYSWGGQEIVGYRAMLGVPIFVDAELIGVINVVRNEPRPFAGEHIELVKTFADQAAIAVANARLMDAVERQRTELSRFVSPQVAELLSSDEGEKMLAGHRAYVSCLFCDLRGFTAFAETAAPEELFEVLGDYHLGLGELIPTYEGTLEHFAGDGLMVFFNDPLPVDEHELKAIKLALAAQERFGELSSAWRKRGIELGLGVGISAGYATLGRIGFEGRYDYGALGPDTNLASRLSSHAEPGQILISQRVYAAVEGQVEAEPLGETDLKGFGRPVTAYEVRGLV